ncbi:hypothetical protein BIT28_16190 [Photobacterium proteolyticum]|uniref:Uncharacterized protein n=1 Tax=Photobacterium proteolyticum TaxID=1903952 RepID=A0A1Q9GS78_9GAMM|nr:hypothetical protein [Photobacterium proteolyticum]OLQ77576.1 hypothetical protein BIT28_16190 [Photobacterium proteolyticum]
MFDWFESWLFNRKARKISARLIPWLLFYGDKDKYSIDEVDYAIERAQLQSKDITLAYSIFCNELSSSQFHREEGYADYIANSRKYNRVAQKYGTGSFNSNTSILDDVDK